MTFGNIKGWIMKQKKVCFENESKLDFDSVNFEGIFTQFSVQFENFFKNFIVLNFKFLLPQPATPLACSGMWTKMHHLTTKRSLKLNFIDFCSLLESSKVNPNGQIS